MKSELKNILQNVLEENQGIYELIKQDKPSNYSNRKICSISAYQVCLDHCLSALYLLASGVVSTPLSLLRISCEAFIRATWLCKAATDEQLEKFKGGEFEFPKKKTIFKGIILSSFVGGSALEEFMGKNEKLLHDFTHTGDMQISRRIHGSIGIINEAFEPEEILFIASFMSVILLNSVIGILGLDERHEKIQEAENKYNEIMAIIKDEIIKAAAE